jgi:hypothetical protein
MVVFKVNDVQSDLKAVNNWVCPGAIGDEHANSLADCRTVEAFSHPGAYFVRDQNAKAKNPLIAAVYLAFSFHLPLVLTPDVIWNTIMLGVSQHVGNDPEKHRHAFVNHKGKMTLVVMDNTLRRGSRDNNWGRVVNGFADQIADSLSGKAALTALQTRFTTTDEVARVAHAVVFMDTVKSYFDYTVMTMCGIPSIELAGTREDWQKLQSALTLLDDLDLAEWRSQLDFILTHFEHAFDGKVEQSFWNDIFLEHGAHGSGGVTMVSGWIGTFFLYTTEKLNSGALGEPSETENTSGFYQDSPVKRASDSRYRQVIDPNDFPMGLSETPFKWKYFNEQIEMLLQGGLVGVIYNHETHAMVPHVGWLITEAKSETSISQYTTLVM